MNSPSSAYRQMKFVAAVLLVIFLGTFFYYNTLHDNLFHRKARQEIPEAGPISARPLAMDFTFMDAGTKQKLNLVSLRGKVVHINFWASWCLPCQHELPFLTKMQKENSEDYLVLLINLDTTPDGLSAAKDMQQRLAPDLLSVYDNTNDLRTLFNIEALPFHYIIDKSGRAAAAFYSQLDKSEEKFKKLLLQLAHENP